MDLAKVPDSNDSRWEYVDIFVFSNGQHQTPPRKYHLRSDELNEWEGTLRTLAHSQYDSKQSIIDLYTVDGMKITTPIEVGHENAYVAVPLQDEFIPAGYTEYLLKASRSREKRLGKSKKPHTLSLAPSVEQEKNKTTGKDAESKLPTAGAGTPSHNITSLGDQHALQAQTVNNNSNISGNKINKYDKRSLNNTTLSRRKGSNNPGEMVTHPSLKSKENLLRKNLRVSTAKIATKNPVLIINHNNSLKTKGKVVTKTGKDGTLIDTAPIILNIERSALNPVNEKKITTDSAIMENVIEDKELIVVKNPDSAILDYSKTASENVRESAVVPILPLVEESKTSQVNKEEIALNVINNFVKSENTPQVAVNHELSPHSKNRVNVNHLSDMIINQDSSRNNELLNKNQPTENVVAFIEKGDVISLNLQIEVRKCDGAIRTRYNTDTKKLCSITEKCSQVEIDEEFVQSIEKQSNITNNNAVNSENPKIIVLQCACCGNQDFNEMLQKIDTSYNLKDKKYLILLPNPEYEKHMQSGSGLEPDDTERFSVINPVSKVTKNIKLLNETEMNDAKEDIVPKTQSIGISASQIQSSSRNFQNEELKYENTVNKNVCKEKRENHESASLQKNADDNSFVSNDEDVNSNIHTVRSNISEKNRETESLIIRKNASDVTKQFMESSTQTEWPSLLLEARQHGDGLYSFHLPPLSVLKSYFL